MRRWLSLLCSLAVPVLSDLGPRWLAFCDKRTEAEPGTVAWEDAPVRSDLVDSLKARGWILRTEYRWGNRVSAVPPVGGGGLPACVSDVGPVGHGKRTEPEPSPAARKFGTTGVDPATQALQKIWNAMGIEDVRQSLILSGKKPGNGIKVAMIDSKFAPQHHVMGGIRIADHWDFVEKSPDPWDSLHAGNFSDIHGTSTTGLIASRWDGLPGIAPYATFLLYRAEDNASESTAEEDNLAAAFVRAVDSGAQIISVSLGYRFVYDNDTLAFHPWSDYDGRTLVASLAALGAARRNVLVVVASGNDGRLGTRSIGSPADADSILVVGAVDGGLKPCGFSSWGPTADGRQKPDVVSFGCTVPVAGSQGTSGIELEANGTSFSTPLVAGLAALAWQLEPGVSAMRLLAQIKASGSSADAPGLVIGYGLPDLRHIEDVSIIVSRSKSQRLPSVWNPQADPLLFRISSALGGSNLDLVLTTPSGRILFRRSGSYQIGASLWNPVGPSVPRQGILLARWKGDYGTGSQIIVVRSP